MSFVRVKCERACQQSRKASEASSPNRESWGQDKDLALQLHGCKTILTSCWCYFLQQLGITCCCFLLSTCDGTSQVLEVYIGSCNSFLNDSSTNIEFLLFTNYLCYDLLNEYTELSKTRYLNL